MKISSYCTNVDCKCSFSITNVDASKDHSVMGETGINPINILHKCGTLHPTCRTSLLPVKHNQYVLAIHQLQKND